MKKDFILTVENFDSNIDKVVKYIQKHPPKNNDEFKDYTRRFYGVELNCKVTVYPDNSSMGIQYEVVEYEHDYCQGELYQLWEDKFGQYDGLKVLLNACFGELCCGGVASHHYGQTEPLSNGKREILRHWDVFDNDLKLLQSALEQRKAIEDIFGCYPF